MPKPLFRLLPVFLAVLPFALPASAQTQPTDSLGGKTVHVFLPARVPSS
jgi:CBS-domain-containing membrane protein